jgi:hypothetical protein
MSQNEIRGTVRADFLPPPPTVLYLRPEQLRQEIEILQTRLDSLESRWYERLYKWIQKVLACL